jgi:hypothetical protein
MHRLSLLFAALSLLMMSSCLPVSYQQAWTYADLRSIDPVDDTSLPSTNILAVYVRTHGSDIEIRIDLLDLPLKPDYHLLIQLDTLPGGDPWDLTIDLPASGHPAVTPANPLLIPRLIRDPWLDFVTIRFNRFFLPQPFSLQVESFSQDGSQVEDVVGPVHSDATPPPTRSPLVIEFWDVFPAGTPAQALRLWAGAHTGPNGGRHGLKYILDNADRYGIPVALLDARTPTSLAAMDYLKIIPQLQQLSSRNLLILPDVAFGEPASISLGFSRQASQGFGLSTSQFAYNVGAQVLPGYPAQFLPLDDGSRLARAGQTLLIPLPYTDPGQVDQDGPSLDARRSLVAASFSPDRSHLVVLGGDLPESPWANEDMASATFAWIAAHPWIQPLSGEDLIAFPAGISEKVPAQPSAGSSSLLAELSSAPSNQLTESAWQAYFMLSAPTGDEKLEALQKNYLGLVEELLAAADWASHTSVQSSCDQDLTDDGQPECILSNEDFLAILEPTGARLVMLFYLDQSGPHQLVGPSSQFTTGLSDPSEWQLDLGQAADPSVIPGAFSDLPDSWQPYSLQTALDSITFTNADKSCTKTYSLLEDGLQVTYQVTAPVSTRIPLAVDPRSFFFSPTTYQSEADAGSWTWGLEGGLQVEIESTAKISATSFIDSLPYLPQPEDPNFDYPEGHYLPFPLSVIKLQSDQNFSVQIRIK